jgi:hypothetical protein
MKMPGIKFPIVDDDRFQAPRYAGAIGFDLALSGKNTSKNSSETLIIKFMVVRLCPAMFLIVGQSLTYRACQ